MKVFRIEAKTYGREVYYVQAEDTDEARRKWEDGDVPEPSVSEVLDSDLLVIEEANE